MKNSKPNEPEHEAAVLASPEHLAQRRLIEAASHLFVEKGYAATSVNEIVEAAGVTKPMLYYYFKSKEAIYLEIVGQACGRFTAMLSEHESPQGADTPAIDSVVALARRMYDLFMENVDVARLIYAREFGPPLSAPAYDMSAVQAAYLHTLQQIVERGLERGELIGEPGDIMWAIAGMIDTCLMAEVSCCCDHKPGNEGMERMLRLLHRGLASQGAGASPATPDAPCAQKVFGSQGSEGTAHA